MAPKRKSGVVAREGEKGAEQLKGGLSASGRVQGLLRWMFTVQRLMSSYPSLTWPGHQGLSPGVSVTPSCLSCLSPISAWQVVGCDYNLDSSKQEDKCLQCGGDGTTCYPVTGTFEANDLSRGGVLRGSIDS